MDKAATPTPDNLPALRPRSGWRSDNAPWRRGGAWLTRLALLLILLAGAYFRFLSITDWDSGTGQHPDERFFTDVSSTVRLPASLGELYDSSRSPLNPRSYSQFPMFVYGPFPVILTRAVAVSLTPNDDGEGRPVLPLEVPSIAGPPRVGADPAHPNERRTDFGPPIPNPERSFPKLTPLQWLVNPEGKNLTTYGEIVKVGRVLAALFDLGSIILIFLIGARLFSRRVGLLAALLSAFTVMQIQQSHFFVDPIFSTFFALLALYWAVRVAQGGGAWAYVALGASIGAGMANRITLATLGLVAITAAVIATLRLFQRMTDDQRPTTNDQRPTTNDQRPTTDDRRLPEPTTDDSQNQRPTTNDRGPTTGDRGPGTEDRHGVVGPWSFVFGQTHNGVQQLSPGSPSVAAFIDRFFARSLPLLVLAGAITLLTFRTLSPDSFSGTTPTSPAVPGERPLDIGLLQGWGYLDMRPEPRFIENLGTVRSLVTGEYDFPPSQQWVGRPAYLFPWTNMVLWGMGPALGVAAWLSWLAFAVLSWRHRGAARAWLPPAAWVLWIWVAFYFGWQGSQFAITMRYLLPIYGALIIFAAWGLTRLWDQRRRTNDQHQTPGRSPFVLRLARNGNPKPGTGLWPLAWLRWLVVLVLLTTIGWAYAFSRIYTLPNARVMAAQWMADHAEPGSYVMAEIWDDPVPLQVTNASWGGTFEGIQSAPYAEDELRKYIGTPNGSGGYDEGLLDQLDRADYITLTSNRIYGSTQRLPMRYPALMRYYHHLFSGELGFELAAEITSYPTILGVRIPDQSAEEAFTVYDHQRVLIFKKTAAYSRERAEQLIIAGVSWGEVYKSPVQIADRNPTALRLTDSQWPAYRAGGTWSALFDRASWVNALAPLVWLLVIELLGLAAFALLFRLFPQLPDRGFSLAKILGLLAVAYLAWLAGSFKVLPFTPGTLWLCAAPLLILGAGAAWGARAELRAFWAERRQAILSAEAIFLGFFLIGLTLRWLNPDLWHPARGGEKPMDIAYLNAVLKSAAFPPYDPWHAGGYINYYYFGFVIVGALIHLTTVVPSIGYNLAVATIFALTALGAWGAVYNLLAGGRGDQGTRGQGDKGASPGTQPASSLRDRIPLISAALAPVFVLLLGNMAQALWYLNGYAAEQGGRPEWAFWDATRIVPGTVNEFPFFTFLFADLHAHMIVMPLSLALLGLGVAWVITGGGRGLSGPHPLAPSPAARERGDAPQRHAADAPARIDETPAPEALRDRDRDMRDQARAAHPSFAPGAATVGMIGLMGLLAGALRVTNTWDYPTFVGLTALALALAAWRMRHGGALRAIGWFVGPLVVILALGNILFAPFIATFATESSGLEPLREGLAPTMLEQVLLAQRTTVGELLQLYGHWIVVATIAGLLLARRFAGDRVAAGIGIGLAALAAGGILRGWAAPLLLLPLVVLGAWLIWQLRRAPVSLILPTVWGAAALGLCLLVELVVVKGDVGRMNTVFKFGLHAWTLFGLAAAVAVPRLWRKPEVRSQKSEVGEGATAPVKTRPLPAVTLIRGTLAVLGVAALVYPITATPARVGDRWAPAAPRGLDGTAFFASVSEGRNGAGFSLDEDLAAIDWLQRNVPGTPVIVEAHLPSYQWAGRVATFTGLPTILGWEWHQVQQRNVVGAGPVIGYRQQVVRDIYNTPDPQAALELLRLYGVEYLYLGGVERVTYDPVGLAKFDLMVQQGELEQVFSQGATQIFRITNPGRPAMLTSDLPVVAPTRDTPLPLLLSEPVNELPAVDEYAWNSLVRGSSWLSLLIWLAVLYGLTLLGLPLAHLVFGRWRDGGLIWARLIGLILLGYTVWLPTSLGLWRYDAWGVLGGLLVVLGLNSGLLVTIGRQGGQGDRGTGGQGDRGTGGQGDESGMDHTSRLSPLASRLSAMEGIRAIVANLRARRRGALIGELVFLVGFLALAGIRALNPDLWHPVWGGEKPMEFGFLNAILRSPVMPPLDPFYSDGYINYYYYGLYLVSLPIKIAGVAPAVGFNLAVATVFGLTLAAAYAAAAQISGRARYGALAAALVGVAGNLAGFFALGWSRGFGAVLDALSGGLGSFGARLGDWYIGPSRVIPNTINEFPFFTFLFADLHPHMIALPITLLAVALGYRVAAGGRGGEGTRGQGDKGTGGEGERGTGGQGDRGTGEQAATGEQIPLSPPPLVPPSSASPPPLAPLSGATGADGARSVPTLLLLALTLGTLAVTNSWDFPTYALLGGMALLGAAWRAAGRRGRDVPWIALLRAALLAVAVAFGGLLLYTPFFDRFYAMVGGVGQVPLTDGTSIRDYLAVYGLFVAVVLPLVLGALWRIIKLHQRDTTSPVALGIVATSNRLPQIRGQWLLAALVLVVAAVAAVQPILTLRATLAALLLIGGLLLLRRAIGAPIWYALLLAWVAWAVGLGTELVFIKDHLAGGDWYRMNTVFKFGMQSWVLLALAAAVGLPYLLRGLRRVGGQPAQSVGLALLTALAALAAIYPLAGVPSRVANRFPVATGPTLDGLAFMRQASFEYDCAAFGGCEPGDQRVTVDLSGDAEAIAWLNQSISGTPIVLQSNLWFYRAYGIRISANTGLPTVISALHANEQRDGFLTAIRDRDVESFYRTPDVDTALRILAKYRVNYVYVGGVERAFYPSGLVKFDQMRGSYLEPVFDTPRAQIYKVLGIPDSYARPLPYDFAADPQPPRPQAQQPDGEPAEAPAAPAPAPAPAADAPADLADFEAAVRANPTDGPLAFGLAERYRAMGRLDDAARVLEPASQANAGDIGVHHLLGDILGEAGRYEEAERAYLRAIQADPSAGNYNKLATALLGWGELEKAEITLLQAIEADPTSADPYYRLGQLYAQRGDRAQATAALQSYLQLAPEGAWAADARNLLEGLR